MNSSLTIQTAQAGSARELSWQLLSFSLITLALTTLEGPEGLGKIYP